MWHLQFVRNGYELTWIPKTGCLFDGKDINQRSNGKNDPAGDVIDLLVIEH
jgi:hypothetical protein